MRMSGTVHSGPLRRHIGARAAGAVAGLLLFLVPAVPAQQAAVSASYTVELIIFRASNIGTAEDWNAAPQGRGFGNGSGRSGPAPQLIRVLGADQYKLSGIEASLRGSGAWRPIAHAAWSQSASNWGGAHAGLSLQDVGIDVPGLSGTVYLERGQFLHLGFDVSLGGGPVYRIDEMRSVRFGDKLYFDHPAFGIIAVVTAGRRAAEAAAGSPSSDGL